MNLVNPALTLPKAANSSVSPDSFTPVQTQTTPAAAPTDQADFKRQKQELLGQILEMQRFMANLAIEQPEHWINWGIAKLRGKKTSKELLEKGALRLDQLSSQLAVGGIGLSEARQKFRAILRENNIPFSEAVEAESNVFENLAFVAETVDKLSDQGVQEILEYKFGSEVAFFGSGAYRALKLILREYLTVKNESDCPSDDKAIWQKAFDRIMQNGTWKPAFQATAQDYLQRKFSRSVPKEVGEVLQSGVLYFGTDLMSQVMSNLLYEKPPFENLDAKSLGLSFVIGLAGGVLGKQLDKTNLSDIHKLLIEAGYDGLSAVFQEIILQLDDGVSLKEIFSEKSMKALFQQLLLESTGNVWVRGTNSIKNNQENKHTGQVLNEHKEIKTPNKSSKEENNITSEEKTQGKAIDNRQEIQRLLVYEGANLGRLEDYISQVQNLIKTYESQGKSISVKQAVAQVLSVEQTTLSPDTGLQMNLGDEFEEIPLEEVLSVHGVVKEAITFQNLLITYFISKGTSDPTDIFSENWNLYLKPEINWDNVEDENKGKLVASLIREAEKHGARLSLINADLSNADIQGANLSGACLSLANLSNANLQGANLQDARLNNSDLSNVNLQKAILFKATLPNTNLTGANLIGADLTGADLSFANLSGTNLQGANFRETNLSAAVLLPKNYNWPQEIEGKNLQGANLLGVNLAGVNFDGVILDGIKNADLRVVENPESIDWKRVDSSSLTTEGFSDILKQAFYSSSPIRVFFNNPYTSGQATSSLLSEIIKEAQDIKYLNTQIENKSGISLVLETLINTSNTGLLAELLAQSRDIDVRIKNTSLAILKNASPQELGAIVDNITNGLNTRSKNAFDAFNYFSQHLSDNSSLLCKTFKELYKQNVEPKLQPEIKTLINELLSGSSNSVKQKKFDGLDYSLKNPQLYSLLNIFLIDGNKYKNLGSFLELAHQINFYNGILEIKPSNETEIDINNLGVQPAGVGDYLKLVPEQETKEVLKVLRELEESLKTIWKVDLAKEISKSNPNIPLSKILEGVEISQKLRKEINQAKKIYLTQYLKENNIDFSKLKPQLSVQWKHDVDPKMGTN